MQPALLGKGQQQALANHLVEYLPAQSPLLLGRHLAGADRALHLHLQLLTGDGLAVDLGDFIAAAAE